VLGHPSKLMFELDLWPAITSRRQARPHDGEDSGK
jgi:hypothetical protein